MVHVFCTVKEAAEELRTSQEQIETLLKEGVLREFRDGPHRLLKAAEVGALAASRSGDITRRERSSGQELQRTLSPSQGAGPAGRPASEIRLPHSPAAAVRSPGAPIARPKRMQGTQQSKPAQAGTAHPRSPAKRAPRPQPLAVNPQHKQIRFARRLPTETQDMSLCRWFWAGLTQDRPAAIALLCCLVGIAMFALVGGICMLCEIF